MHAPGKQSHSTAAGALSASTFARRRALVEITHATRSSALGELAASIAHELSEPITAIVADAGAGLNWLNRSKPDLQAVRESLEAIVCDVRRAGDLLERMRGLIERAPQQHRACDVSSIVQSVVLLLQRQLKHAGIALEVLLARDSPDVIGDAVELQQVVLNLVLNAVQAVSACAPERRRIAVRSVVEHRMGKNWVVVSTEDGGPGIAVADPARLSICRSILARHGGHVWAEPHGGQGAVFHFALPASASAP